MSIEDDVALMERVRSLRLLGAEALRVLAIGSEQKDFARGAVLFREGEPADCGYIVQAGSFKMSAEFRAAQSTSVGPGTLIDELALLVPQLRAATATANEYATVIRIGRSLFQRVLESDPKAALRLRDDLADRSNALVGDILNVRHKIGL